MKALLAALLLAACGADPKPAPEKPKVHHERALKIEEPAPPKKHGKHEHSHLHPHDSAGHHHHPHPHPHMDGDGGHHHPF